MGKIYLRSLAGGSLYKAGRQLARGDQGLPVLLRNIFEALFPHFLGRIFVRRRIVRFSCSLSPELRSAPSNTWAAGGRN